MGIDHRVCTSVHYITVEGGTDAGRGKLFAFDPLRDSRGISMVEFSMGEARDVAFDRAGWKLGGGGDYIHGELGGIGRTVSGTAEGYWACRIEEKIVNCCAPDGFGKCSRCRSEEAPDESIFGMERVGIQINVDLVGRSQRRFEGIS